MPVASGRQIEIGLGRETAAGTKVAASHWFPTTSRDIRRNIMKIPNQQAVGSMWKTNNYTAVRHDLTGSFGGVINPDTIPLLLASAFSTGIRSTKTGSGTSLVGSHTIGNENSTTPMSMTIYVKTPNYTESSTLCRLSTLELNLSSNDFCMYTANFMGQKVATEGTITTAYKEDYRYASSDVKVQVGTSITNAKAAAGLQLESFNVTMNNELEGYAAVTSDTYPNFFSKSQSMSGSMTLLFENDTQRNTWINDSALSMVLTLTSTKNIGSSSSKYIVEFELPAVTFTNFTESRGTDEIQKATVDFDVTNNPATGSDVTIKVNNGVENY